MNIPKLELVTFALCPYVQRSIITLEEKNIPHNRIDIDLGNKPEWFKELSPMGKVPLLIVDDRHPLFESAVICDYLDEITPGSLQIHEPLEKAYHKAWIEFGSQTLNNIAKLYNAKTKSEFNNTLSALTRRFELLESETKAEPYFNGKTFLLIDAVYSPIFRYFEVFDLHFKIDIFENLPKVQVWRTNLMQRNSVKQAVREEYPVLLTDYLVKRKSYISSLLKI
ncbi:glutathione S-transferase family protein [Agaribacter marinus]|uniref:glutathione transferase n=1 Tax=Agaribacter marinus TaxID=1431249 RepID=A0AA37T7N5_9ALTE|nr:glutathione S-transferase family protein [Agaribacter marinus]GLR72985.1 glutathione S-transferase [Agaribacter marinus]